MAAILEAFRGFLSGTQQEDGLPDGQPVNLYRAVFVVLALLLFGYFLYSVREVLILFVLAFLLGYAINPLIEWPQQRGVPRAVSLALVLVGLLALLVLGFYWLIPPPLH